MRTLAVILARKGSKGLPGKNVLPVAGRPCVEWTIRDALRARTLDDLIVSSDDEAVWSICHELDVPHLERPEQLASDEARVDDAVRGSIGKCKAAIIVILYGNVPVRPPGLIDRAVGLLRRTGCDSVQSYEPVGKHHPWWTARVDEDSGEVHAWEGDVLNHGVHRRQDLPPAFVPSGGVIAVRRRALELQIPNVPPGPHAFLGRDRRGVIDPEGSTVDIDSNIDLLVADAILSERKRAAA